MVLVFLDESGDLGLSGKPGASPYFSVGLLIVSEDNARILDGLIDDVRRVLSLSARFEFKFARTDSYRLTHSLTACRGVRFRTIVAVIDNTRVSKDDFPDSASLYI